METIFLELSVIVVIAALLAYLSSLLRQPLIIGYIVAGIIVGPSALNLITATDLVTILSELGVALLLFMVGLSLDPKMIKNLGKVALYTGLGQLIFTTAVGYAICRALLFSPMESLYLSSALAFSSTIIIMKLLSDKEQLYSLYGRIVVGFLLVQDIAAILMMMAISSSAKGNSISEIFTNSLFSGIILLIAVFAIARYLLPLLDHHLTKSTELLFLASIAWCMALGSVFKYFGFSIEIGALLAGISLAATPYGCQIGARIRPLRDFFIVVFFITLGSSLTLQGLTAHQIATTGVLSAFVLIGDPLIVMLIMRYLRFPRHVGFLSGLTVAQVSEFSLIMVALGVKLGHIDQSILVITTIVGLVTIAISSYMITYGDMMFERLNPYLRWFEPAKVRKIARAETKRCRSVLFGYNRIGFDTLNSMRRMRGQALVIDYNPQTVRALRKQGINCMYGDANDVMLLDDVDLRSPRLFVSTIPSAHTTLNILQHIRSVNKKAIVIVSAQQIQEALEFYKAGASFVLLPHFISGSYAAQVIDKYKTRRAPYEKERKRHLTYLIDRLAQGHDLPPQECRETCN